MSRQELLALADRVERATGPSRGLDVDIALALKWHPPGVDPRLFVDASTRLLYADRTPSYTASLDAAMTLVPEGCRWAMRSRVAGERAKKAKPFFAHIESRDFKSVTWGKGENWITDIVRGWEVDSFAAAPALALTAACLRARAAIAHATESRQP